MFYTAHGAYRGSGSSCRNLERVVLVSGSTVYRKLHRLVHKSILEVPCPGYLAGIPGSPAAIYHFLMDVASRAIMSCPVRRCEKRV